MPKLSKIRLTGCKYDGLRKEHENSIFDLTKDGVADHTLFTLCNGGGKGVMMQLIFQLLLPETRWGKNNGNKVISMFYDQRNNLYPFTFHVVLEWILDTIPERRLITGIAVKAIIKNTGSEEEEKTGLSYFLYTHEYENSGYYTIENLPLYDKNTGEAVDIDVLENFINDNKRDFIKYSQSGVRRKDGEYFRYLESRGIYRSEWINLKSINKLEGGSGDYFIGASDNKSIFDKVIIPAISENIKNHTYDDGDNLIEMFRSNLSITKDLPILIKREGDYKDLLVEIKPLIENADSGSRFIDIRDRLINEGNDIFFILKDEENLVIEEIEKWQNEEKRAEEERDDLEFRKDNLYYNKERKDVETKEQEAEELETIFKEKSNEIIEKNEELLLYKINEVLYHKKEVETQINNKILEKERLVEALDISDIKAKADELNDEIKSEWNKTKINWINSEKQYVGYINYTDNIKEENNSKKKKYEHKVDELQNEVNKFEIKEEELNKYRSKLGEHYDPLSLAFPERIVEDLEKTEGKIKEEIDVLNNNIETYEENIYILNREIDRLNHELDNKKENVTILKENIKEQEQYELEIARLIAKQLLENYDGSLLNHNWFNKKLEQLQYMEDGKKKNLQSVQRAIWEKNIERLLNKEDYFIANKDIVLIKDEISKIGIHAETGSEYLKQINEEERINILNNNSGFLYSVVIASQRDWEIIDKNIDKDLFLNSMVPIYIRSEMNSPNSEMFKVVYGKAHELVDTTKYIAWKSAMENEIESLVETENSIKDDLDNIAELIQEIKIINTRDTAFILNQKLKEEENKIGELLDKIRVKEEEKLNINNKLGDTKNTLKESEDRLEKINNSIKQIREYIEKVEEIEKERVLILKIEKDMKELKDNISDIDDDNESIIKNQNLIKDSYRDRKKEIEDIIKSVNEVFKEAVYNFEVDNSYTNYKTPDLSIFADRLMSLVNERKVLEEDISGKDSKIAILDNDIKHFKKDFDRYIEDLQKLSMDWTNYTYLDLSLNEVNIIINEISKNIERLEEEKRDVKSRLDNNNGSIKIMKDRLSDKERHILKLHKKTPLVLEIENIDSEIDIVERDIKSNKIYLQLCTDELQKNKDKRSRLEINLTKIKSGYILDLTKGNMDKILKGKIQDNPDLIVDEWLRKCRNNEMQINKTIDEGEKFRTKFIKEVDFKLEEDKLKEKIIMTVKEANIVSFKNNLVSFKSMENHFQHELLRLSKDKSKAEEAMKQWTNRASIHVIRMVEALKSMVAGMNYTNEQGYAFPLVKLKGAERLPKEEAEVTYLLDEYFIQSISKILETSEDIDNIDDKTLKDLMGDKVIFSKALQGRYPTLLVYKMSEKNEFRYARARDEYYTTWEAINKGEGDLPEGSGGQTLSVNTFVIMMIMSFKKKHIGNENPSTVLTLDNPFGQASAKHVLDPIFEIANKLNFQLICFAAPEIIKVEISERFPVFWELKIEDGKVVHGGRVISSF